jgi:hypothetical protein
MQCTTVGSIMLLSSDVDPDPYDPYRYRMFLDLPDLDPLVRVTDPDPPPDPEPSIIEQK